MGQLAGKVAVITGAASGIGKETAALFAREGAKVAVADIAAAGEDVAAGIRAAGGDAFFVRIDVTEEESVRAAFAAVEKRYGRLDVLHNNAGGSSQRDARVTDVPMDEFWRTVKLDLGGTFLCSRHGVPLIAKSGGGSVINMTSIVALRGVAGRDSYTAAKGAIASLTRSMAREYAPDRIRVNAIAPGATQTERVLAILDAYPDLKSSMTRDHLLGLGTTADVAAMALYLASDQSRVVTGQIMSVDSGATI